MTLGCFYKFFGGAAAHNLTASIASFGTYINKVINGFDHV